MLIKTEKAKYLERKKVDIYILYTLAFYCIRDTLFKRTALQY